MFDSSLGELLLVVLRFVEPDNQRNPHLFENWNVIVWSERTILVCHIQRSTKTDELPRDCPVQVAVLDLFVVLVLDHVECLVIVPTEFDCKIKAI